MNIDLNLTIDEINFMLNIIAKEPYCNVFELIDKIKKQTNDTIDSNAN